MTYYECSLSAESLLKLWAYLLCFAGIAGIIYAIINKRLKSAVIPVLQFAVVYLLWQIMIELDHLKYDYDECMMGVWYEDIPWYIYVLLLAVMTVLTVFSFCREMEKVRNSITPSSIKRCADSMPCGICYWNEDGKILFSNTCMNELCFSITGESLSNGERFHSAVAAGVMRTGDSTWNFVHKEMELYGKPVHELIAADVSELYAKSERLKDENERLTQLKSRLEDYYRDIDEMIRRQEILRARMNIHDEMNQLMLATVSAGRQGKMALDTVFSRWNQNTLVMCREGSPNEIKDSLDELKALAAALNMDIHLEGEVPQSYSRSQAELFFAAAREAMANALKHADAESMKISFKRDGGYNYILYSNDGSLPDGEVTFTGGLKNIKHLAKLQGGDIEVRADKEFTLTLFFPIHEAGHREETG